MLWLKRNLLLIVGVLVAGGLMALAAMYLLKQKGNDKKAADSLKEQTAELERLVTMSPSLSEENITAAKAEAQKIQQLAPQLKPLLEPPAAQNLDNIAYKSLLENTISQLQQEADGAGVTLPARYSFTFAAQRPVLNYPTNAIQPLAAQLGEIRELCSILFKCKVHSLENLRRVRVYAEEPPGTADYLEQKMIVTNGLFTVTPYEVVFRGFSLELGQVLDGLQRSPIFFVIKKVQVQTIQIAQPVEASPPPAPNIAAAKAKPAGSKAGAATNAPPAQTSLVTVMDEKPLRITLALEVVKLAPAGPTAQPAPAAPAAQPPPSAN